MEIVQHCIVALNGLRLLSHHEYMDDKKERETVPGPYCQSTLGPTKREPLLVKHPKALREYTVFSRHFISKQRGGPTANSCAHRRCRFYVYLRGLPSLSAPRRRADEMKPRKIGAKNDRFVLAR